MRKYLLFIIFSAALIGCEPKEQPVSREEAMDFAERLEFSIRKKKPNSFDSVFNYDVFCKLVAKEADIKPSRSFNEGIEVAIHQRLTKELIQTTEKDGTYEFVRQYEKDGKQHVIFRLYSDEGLNYHDMELTKRDGKVNAADAFILISGENLSITLGRLMGTFNEYSKKRSSEQTDRLLASVRDVRSLIDLKRFKEAKDLYDKLPSDFRKDRVLMLYNLQISSQLGEEEYISAMDDFESRYGNDASAQLTLLDGYIIRKEFGKALKAIDVVDSVVRRDAFLNYPRALIYYQMNDTNNYVKYLELLIKEKPGFENGLLELIAAYLQSNDNEKAKQLVEKYKANKSLNQENLTNLLYMYPVSE